ncbi:MAG: glycosyltransferase family 4 protein [Candidatus Pacearchaeota archaeon]
MKIAFVNDTFIEGRGADTAIYELARRLGKKHKVYVIAGKSRGFKEENFKIIEIKTGKLYTGSLRDYFYFSKIKQFRKEILKLNAKYKFDVFNVHHSALNPAFKGLNIIVTWNGSPPTNNIIRKILNKIVLITLNRNKKTIAISNFLKNELSKFINKEKISMIYDGVSNEFKFSRKDKGYMFFVGRHEPHKSIDELIKLSKNTNFPLIIAGSGPLSEKLKDYSKKIHANKVKFVGKVSRKKLISLYQECSFFVSASKWEGFGLIFLEAAACGKPSIAYNRCSMPEVIKNNKTGFLVNNYNEFVQKARLLIENKNLRKKMGKEALKFSKNFGWDKIANKYENLFKSLKNE